MPMPGAEPRADRPFVSSARRGCANETEVWRGTRLLEAGQTTVSYAELADIGPTAIDRPGETVVSNLSCHRIQ